MTSPSGPSGPSSPSDASPPDRPSGLPPGLPHVLMTRFNLATPGREAAIRNRPDWLEGRFDLFERFCLPSVKAQTTRDFTWIVYFDENTPQTFKDRVRALQTDTPFIAYYTGLFPASGWPRSLGEHLGTLPDRVLTSRLDNDDALADDYMARTANAAARALTDTPDTARIGIVLTNGYIRSQTRAYRIAHPSNAFTSWLERTDDPDQLLTAMGISHMEAADFGPLVQVDGPGGWLQVVHGHNVSNKVRGWRIASGDLAPRFHPGALDGLDTAPAAMIALENGVLAPLRGGRDWLVTAARRLRRPAP